MRYILIIKNNYYTVTVTRLPQCKSQCTFSADSDIKLWGPCLCKNEILLNKASAVAPPLVCSSYITAQPVKFVGSCKPE